MKKIIIIANLILICSFNLKSQNFDAFFGTGVSKFNFKQVNDPTYISQFDKYEDNFVFSLYGGLGYEKSLIENVSGRIGISYSKRGNNSIVIFSDNLGGSDSLISRETNGKLYMNYIDIPFTIHFKKFHSFIGGQVSYFFRGKSYGETTTIRSYNGIIYDKEILKSESVLDKSILKYYNRIDYGIVLGLEYPIYDIVNLSIRYYQGLNRLIKDDYFSSDWNCQIIFLATYNLGFKKK